MTSCDTYANFKTKFTLEDYLTYLSPMSRLSFCRFRLNNTRLPKVLGRYTQTPREQRLCTLCTNDGLIGDEFYLLLECSYPQLTQLRSKYIDNSFTKHPSMQKCIELTAVIRNLAMFLRYSLISSGSKYRSRVLLLKMTSQNHRSSNHHIFWKCFLVAFVLPINIAGIASLIVIGDVWFSNTSNTFTTNDSVVDGGAPFIVPLFYETTKISEYCNSHLRL